MEDVEVVIADNKSARGLPENDFRGQECGRNRLVVFDPQVHRSAASKVA